MALNGFLHLATCRRVMFSPSGGSVRGLLTVYTIVSERYSNISSPLEKRRNVIMVCEAGN